MEVNVGVFYSILLRAVYQVEDWPTCPLNHDPQAPEFSSEDGTTPAHRFEASALPVDRYVAIRNLAKQNTELAPLRFIFVTPRNFPLTGLKSKLDEVHSTASRIKAHPFIDKLLTPPFPFTRGE